MTPDKGMSGIQDSSWPSWLFSLSEIKMPVISTWQRGVFSFHAITPHISQGPLCAFYFSTGTIPVTYESLCDIWWEIIWLKVWKVFYTDFYILYLCIKPTAAPPSLHPLLQSLENHLDITGSSTSPCLQLSIFAVHNQRLNSQICSNNPEYFQARF